MSLSLPFFLVTIPPPVVVVVVVVAVRLSLSSFILLLSFPIVVVVVVPIVRRLHGAYRFIVRDIISESKYGTLDLEDGVLRDLLEWPVRNFE